MLWSQWVKHNELKFSMIKAALAVLSFLPPDNDSLSQEAELNRMWWSGEFEKPKKNTVYLEGIFILIEHDNTTKLLLQLFFQHYVHIYIDWCRSERNVKQVNNVMTDRIHFPALDVSERILIEILKKNIFLQQGGSFTDESFNLCPLCWKHFLTGIFRQLIDIDLWTA